MPRTTRKPSVRASTGASDLWVHQSSGGSFRRNVTSILLNQGKTHEVPGTVERDALIDSRSDWPSPGVVVTRNKSHDGHDGGKHAKHANLINVLPGVSQAKSAVQFVLGDSKGAAETQHEFLQGCPVVSQCTSGVQALRGNKSGAVETQRHQGRVIGAVMDKIPVIGHAKALVHYSLGQRQKGHESAIMATRGLVVMASGAVGLVGDVASCGTTAGAMAVGAGVSAGVAYDNIVTRVTGTPFGYVAAYDAVRKGNMTTGQGFDAVLMPFADGLNASGGLGAAQGLMDGAGAESQAMSTSCVGTADPTVSAHHANVAGDYSSMQHSNMVLGLDADVVGHEDGGHGPVGEGGTEGDKSNSFSKIYMKCIKPFVHQNHGH